ncbi:hypothetical protein LCGC14_1285400 [marine sediment metagenome]|uniref:Uncharacterized protein n=1 Tax=marine sediment metagenome TaxID=412755 RepID=A0A0F9NX45_9ZZZZ
MTSEEFDYPTITYGGKMGWCYSKAADHWSLCLLYWIVRKLVCLVRQVASIRKLFHTSGFIHRGRGRHFVYSINKGRNY